jgi:hypothetical protein
LATLMQPGSARLYFCMGRWLLPCFYFCQVGLPNYWWSIFLVLPKLDGCRVSWQTTEDALKEVIFNSLA